MAIPLRVVKSGGNEFAVAFAYFTRTGNVQHVAFQVGNDDPIVVESAM